MNDPNVKKRSINSWMERKWRLLSHDIQLPYKNFMKIKRYDVLFYIFACISFVLSYYFAMNLRWKKSDGFLILFFSFLLLATIFLINRYKKREISYLIQVFVILFGMTLLWDLSFFNINNNEFRVVPVVVGLLTLNISTFVVALLLFLKIKGEKYLITKWIINFKNYIPIILLVVLFIILNIPSFSYWFKSDSYTYYVDMKSNLSTWDLTLNGWQSFQIAGHSSFGYSVILTIFNYLFPFASFRIANIFLAILTIIAFYKIISKLYPKNTKGINTLLTFIFTFSPLFFGIIYEMNTDYPMFCFFVWFVYSSLYHRNPFRYLSAILLCFSKEIGVILLGSYILGEYIVRFTSKEYKNKFNYRELLLLLGPVLLAIQIFFSNSGWANEAKKTVSIKPGNAINTLQFNVDYIIHKVKELFVLNFSWLIIFFIILLLIFILKHRKKITFDDFFKPVNLGLIVSFFAFLCFSFLFFTYAHYRYLIIFVFFYVLSIAWICNYINFKKIKTVLLFIMSICFFVESFFTVDPLTLISFQNISTGSREVITTKKYVGIDGCLYTKEQDRNFDNYLLLDSTTYNRDQINIEKTIESAFNIINYNEFDAIMIPPVFGSTEFTIYNVFGRSDLNSYFWDSISNNITDDIGVSINWITPAVSYEEFGTYKDVYYFAFPYKSDFKHEVFLNSFDIIETFEVHHYGWNLPVYKIKIRG